MREKLLLRELEIRHVTTEKAQNCPILSNEILSCFSEKQTKTTSQAAEA